MSVDDVLNKLEYHTLISMMKGMMDCESEIANENQVLLLQEADVQAEENNNKESVSHGVQGNR